MKTKLYTFLIALAALALGANVSAQTDYGISIYKTKITSANASDVTGPGITKRLSTSKISYNDATKTLTLNNIDINAAGITNSEHAIHATTPITIKLVGTSNVTGSGDALVYFNNPGVNSISGFGQTLKVNSNDVYPAIHSKVGTINILRGVIIVAEAKHHPGLLSNHLRIWNANVKSKGVTNSLGCNSLELEGAVIASPIRTVYNSSKSGIVYKDSKELVANEWVEIKPGTDYNFDVAGIDVTSLNSNAITGSGITGTVRYNHTTSTLTLHNAKITSSENTSQSGIFIDRNAPTDFKIQLIGSNEINYSSINPSCKGIDIYKTTTFTGSGTLSIYRKYSQAIRLSATGASVTFDGNCTVTAENSSSYYSAINGADNSHTVKDDNATLILKSPYKLFSGISALTLSGNCEITKPQGAYFDTTLKGIAKDGKLVENEQVVIEPVTYYDLWVADTQVHSGNASNIIGEGISGKVSYNRSTNTLTLNNAEITYSGKYDIKGIESGASSPENLKINLIGTNSINHSGTEGQARGMYLRKSTTFSGSGSLSVYRNTSTAIEIEAHKTLSFEGGCTVTAESPTYYGIRGHENTTLEVTNSTLKAKGAGFSIGVGFTSFITTGTAITAPSGAEYSSSLKGVALNGALVKNDWVVIKPVTYYDVWVAGTQVHSGNASNIKGEGITGTVSYNRSTNTLTLNNAEITLSGSALADGIESRPTSLENLKINLTGTNSINHSGTNSMARGVLLRKSTTFSGSGSLSVLRNGGEAFLIDDNNTLSFEGGCTVTLESTTSCGLRGINNNTLKVINSTLKAKGAKFYSIGNDFTSFITTGTAITAPSGAEYSSSLKGVALNGSLVKNDWVVIEPVTNYALSIAGTQVHSGNASDIKGEGITGTVSYDHSTKTLTLDNANITTSGGGIRSQIPITISLSGTSTINAGYDGIVFDESGDNVITGSGTLDVKGGDGSSYTAIYYMNASLTITGGCTVTAEAKYGIGGQGATPSETLTVNNATVKAKGSHSSISYTSKLTLENCNITAPEGAAFDESLKGVAFNGALVNNDWVEITPSGTGLESLSSQGISVTGGKGVIHITSAELVGVAEFVEAKTANIYNVSGSLVRTAVIGSGDILIANIPAGIYIVRIGNAAEKVVVW